MASRHLVITGRVQGVGYRAWAVQTARALGVTGWVRNRIDGSVEAVAAGSEDTVDAFVAACRKGPAGARVDDVALADAAMPDGAGFDWRPTV